MEPDENLPKAEDEAQGEVAAPISSKVSGEQALDDEALPSEVVEAIKELPPAQRQIISSLVRVSSHTQSSSSSSLIKRVTSEHITQTLNNLDKENDRGFKKSQSSEVTKRIGMGAILILVLMVFGYAGVTKDKDLAEKVIIAGISGLGGFWGRSCVEQERAVAIASCRKGVFPYTSLHFKAKSCSSDYCDRLIL